MNKLLLVAVLISATFTANAFDYQKCCYASSGVIPECNFTQQEKNAITEYKALQCDAIMDKDESLQDYDNNYVYVDTEIPGLDRCNELDTIALKSQSCHLGRLNRD